ncbi:helix-turn-helix transcriptional regulator [Pseudomaricurvus alkylphenolicus]|uniref:helix-turn-helix transcriptional regulator n=1 Tax=Pseudomaricurvus alkylphenolicus TaxID=1306991 RepID=UPI001420C0BE|nr:helix-turn-helix transcriptional regulator [Pseudomaricurvus alkylphenolicus]NIB40774.1 helix-turn-helix transcriptional regulator [Pseudomaricurvus alkylphenolicus]
MPRVKIEKVDPATFNTRKHELLEKIPIGELTIGQATRAMRLLLGMTQEEYGEKIVGLSRKVVSAIENDQHNPELETLKKIGKPFGFSIGFVQR